MNTNTITIAHDNHEIALHVTSAAGACGIDPSTDGSAGDEYPVRITLTVCWSESDKRVRSNWEVCTLAQTLADALAGREPRWLRCEEHGRRIAIAAIERIVGDAWRDFECMAESALEAEHEAEHETSNDDSWVEALNERSARIDAFAAERGWSVQ